MLAIIFIGPPHALHTLTSISTRGAAELPARPIRPGGKRGRLAQSDTQQKVSGCFRWCQYAEAYCRISSYLQSMAYQGYNPLTAIQFALAGKFDLQTG